MAQAFYLLWGPEIISAEISREAAISKSIAQSTKIQSSEINALGSANLHKNAGLFNNPNLSIEMENWAGSGNFRGFRSAEITYGLSQEFELCTKRSRQIAFAKKNLDIANLEILEKKLNIIKEVSLAYANAVYAQEFLHLALEQKTLADDLFKEVSGRVSSAREPLFEEDNAAIAMHQANLEYEKAKTSLSLAKHTLANHWNGHEEDFVLNSSEFFQISAPLMESQVEEMLPKNSELKLAQAQKSAAVALYELEKHSGFFSINVNLGIRHLLENNDVALVAGISLPLPIFNRNHASTEHSRALVKKSETDIQTVQNDLIVALHRELKNIEDAYKKAQNHKNDIVPRALKSFTLTRNTYSAGKLSYYEVLNAQRTLSVVKEQYLSALRDYHAANAEIERLTAKYSDRPLVKEDGKNEK
jgi:cobalt-zinc-cadmium efflux system outer membrane protein